MPEKRDRIPIWLAAILMISGIALAFIGLIPIVGDIIDVVSAGIFWVIFKFRGVSYSKNYGLAGLAIVSMLIGLIPEVGDFIEDVVGLAIQIYLVRREDKIFNQTQMEAFQARQIQDRIHLAQLEESRGAEQTDLRMMQAERIMTTGRYSDQEMDDPALRAAAERRRQNGDRMYMGPSPLAENPSAQNKYKEAA
jgi:hypothetical protein